LYASGVGRGLFAIGFAALGACNALNGSGDLTIADGDVDADVPPRVEAGADGIAPPPGPPASDAGLDARPDGAVDAGPSVCDPADPNLVLCYPFDVDVADHAPAPVAETFVNVALVAGHVGLGAASFDGATSKIEIAPPSKVDAIANALTIESFVYANSLPAAATATRMGIMDCEARFAVFLVAAGTYCSGGGVTATAPPIATKTWTHVACVVDDTNLTIYYDGTQVAQTAATALVSAGASTSNIGHNHEATGNPNPDVLDGRLDDFRVYSRAKTAAELAKDALR
jgi:hypothetical protein